MDLKKKKKQMMVLCYCIFTSPSNYSQILVCILTAITKVTNGLTTFSWEEGEERNKEKYQYLQ